MSHPHVQLRAGTSGGDLFEELQELLVAVRRIAGVGRLAGGGVEGGEQAGDAVPGIGAGLPFGDAMENVNPSVRCGCRQNFRHSHGSGGGVTVAERISLTALDPGPLPRPWPARRGPWPAAPAPPGQRQAPSECACDSACLIVRPQSASPRAVRAGRELLPLRTGGQSPVRGSATGRWSDADR